MRNTLDCMTVHPWRSGRPVPQPLRSGRHLCYVLLHGAVDVL